MDKVEIQRSMERKFHKNQKLKRLREYYRGLTPILEAAEKIDLSQDFTVDLLAQIWIHKRASVSTLVGLLKFHFETLQECADAIKKAADWSIILKTDQFAVFAVRFDIPKDMQKDIVNYLYPMPMIVPPKKLTRNYQTAYLMNAVDGESVILRKNYHNNDVCLDHLNRMNSVKLSLNTDVIAQIPNHQKALSKPKEGETPYERYQKVKAFAKFNEEIQEVTNHLLITENEFYLTHKYDFRGRTYDQGYHINKQGNEWSKAIIEFADAEPVNKEQSWQKSSTKVKQ